MSDRIDKVETVGQVLLEDEAYTILSLGEHPSLAPDPKGKDYPLTCCDGCPNYTTVPCKC